MQNDAERNFHIFYQILKGATSEDKGIAVSLLSQLCSLLSIMRGQAHMRIGTEFRNIIGMIFAKHAI